MKNVSEFTKTQALIDEYNKLKNKVPKLEAQMEQNKKRTEAKKEKFKRDMQENKEDIEYKLDRAAVEAEYGKQIEQEEKNLEEENGKIKEEINKAKEDKKFFCTDKNFKTITMEINAMNKKIEEYSKFKGELNQQLSTFTAIDFNKMREREDNKANDPEEEYEDIYSNSQDFVKAIHIEAATGKAYIDTFKNNKKEIDIKEAIENRKGLYKRINLKEIMEKAGVESRINQFMLKRKINPVILEAINENEKMTEEYIYSLIEKKEFPFEYKHDLENSNLSFKDMALMNRVALKESKIDGNEVIGAKKLYTIKSFFGKIKNKALAKFNKKEEPKMINEKNERQEDTKSRKERFYESIEYTPEEQNANDIELEQKNKYNEAYEKLTDEQKAKLATMDVSNIQRLGFDYNTAVALREMTNNEDKKVTQESTTKEDKKVTQESTTKEDDESQR